MQANESPSDLSSSPISSAPISPHNGATSDTIQVASRPSFSTPGGGVATNSATSAQPQPASATQPATTTIPTTTQPDKPKRQRKKKQLGPDGKPIEAPPKEKKPRKPREPKEKTNGTSAPPKKRIKTEDKSVESPRQSTISEMMAPSTPAAAVPLSKPTDLAPVPPPLTNTPIARPISSGQKYDPVRGATMETYTRPSAPISAAKPLAQVNRASASPSIASLIDPQPFAVTPSAPLHSPQPSSQPFLHKSPPQTTPTLLQSPVASTSIPSVEIDNTMDIDKTPSSKQKEVKETSKVSSAAPTPKATARSSPPAPRGTGSGLLSSSDLFGGGTSIEGTERKGVNIDIQIKLDPGGGNFVNVAQEIIKKYGRDAINPRAAARRERLLQVMAAANKIDGGSADDMSIDLMSDAGDDSNVEMGGMDDGSAAADGEKTKSKRRKKIEEYDLDDEFIDDTELAWQQQAAVAKDGFFVYSGPLVPEGETARVEAANAGTRGGRGRGGRGGRKAAASGTTHASLAEKKEATPATTAAGKGSRGGRVRATPAARKPRITKADKEKLMAEKSSRERTAAGIGASSAPLPPPLPVPPAQNNTTHTSMDVAT